MRTNLPVTQKDHDYPADATLMSSTDTHSRITYANEAFIQVSGFERDELMNQPHNLVRHPDMPQEAFADMWETLKAGESWTALVKNRRKNGDHYWVRANATPVMRNGQVNGYMSVRTKPSPEEVRQAELLYQAFRKKRNGHLAFHRGLIVHTGIMAWRSVFQRMSVRWRLALPLCWTVAIGALAGHFAGLSGAGLGGLVAALVVSALAGLTWLQTQIATPLAQVRRQASAVAAGQPGKNLQFNRVDDIGALMRLVNQAGLNLRSLVDDVSSQMGGLRQATDEIATGNSDLSHRTESTAAELQRTAASMTQMTSTVRTNTQTAQDATRFADQASSAATHGGEVVSEVVKTMDQISESSRRIADIIGVIDGIAFQTNILALNAAVEAARAGDQGRGFAVVAGEVRSLAQRSAEAAREIKTLIQASVERVSEGSTLVNNAGAAMEDIVSKVQEVTQLIEQISHASHEQSAGIDQVNQAVGHLDEATHQNAVLVQQSSQTASTLSRRASRLADAIGVFKAN
jgi:aerotaxis receptor